MTTLNALLYTAPAPEIPTYRIFVRYMHIHRYIVVRPQSLDVAIFALADNTLINTIHSTIAEGFSQQHIQLTVPDLPEHVIAPVDGSVRVPPLAFVLIHEDMCYAMHRRVDDACCLHVYPA